MKLKDKIAIVTGATSGIGEKTSVKFAEEGAGLVLVGRNQEKLKTLSNEISVLGRKVIALNLDLSNTENCELVVKRTVEHFGKIDILVNSAGILKPGSLMETKIEDWKKTMTLNLDSVFLLMSHAAEELKKTKGNIINISSVTGLRAFPNILSYCVSKAGLDQLTRCTALELAPYGVRVNSVNPGVVVTDIHKRSGMNDENYNAFLEHSKTTHPLGRVGDPKEIAESILFLASENADWITGVTLSVDGGRQITCFR